MSNMEACNNYDQLKENIKGKYIEFEKAFKYLETACEAIGSNGGLQLKAAFLLEEPADVVEVVRYMDPFEGMRIVIQSYATQNGRRETSWVARIDGQSYGDCIGVYDTPEDLWKSIELITDQAKRSIEVITGEKINEGEPVPHWRGNMDGMSPYQGEVKE